MAYNDEALRAKLATLNETQESIVAVSQWIQFHRKYADKIASVWLTRLREIQPPKRLNYIYLVNDIVQNAKARKRQEFPNAFSPLMPEAVQQAYKSAAVDVQNKIKRVLEVWRQRSVFDDSILQAIQARTDDVDKSKNTSGTKKSLMGNSLFSSSTSSLPKELETLGPLQTAVSKAEATCRPLIESAQSADSTLRDPQSTKPTPPVYAARLSDLLKKLATAEASLTETIGARQKLVADLKRILEKNEKSLEQDEHLQLELSAKKSTAEADKREVEDQIMQNLSTSADSSEDVDDGAGDYTRPDVEELTPEPENFASSDLQPARNPALQGLLAGFTSGEAPSYSAQDTTEQGFVPPASFAPDVDDPIGQAQYTSKKRKLSHNNGVSSIPDFGSMGFDSTTDPYATTHTTIEQDVDALIQAHQPQGAGTFPTQS